MLMRRRLPPSLFPRLRLFATSAPGFQFAPVDDARDALAKYRQKLEKKAAEQGFASAEELLKNASKFAVPEPKAPLPRSAKLSESALSPEKSKQFVRPPSKASRSKDLPSYIKPLDEIVDVDRLKEEEAARIETIWNEYHKTQAGMLSGVMPVSFYETMKKNGREFPMFVLPIPREAGVEFYLLQTALNQIYFTSLLEYKTHGTEARPRLTVTHYDDLGESKGVVLMRGEVSDGGVLTAEDARLLVLLTQTFYVTGGAAKRRLVEAFNRTPHAFDYRELVAEAERIL
ncbi:hypothetical protein HDU82_001522 [Entophlyctis luteolus]|nr:hypothetical protein HDU82_001522 [Entophlyctis luteolus]